MIGATIAPPSSDDVRGGAREEDEDLCYSSQAQTTDAAEGGPDTNHVGVAVSPPCSVCDVVCLGVYALSL